MKRIVLFKKEDLEALINGAVIRMDSLQEEYGLEFMSEDAYNNSIGNGNNVIVDPHHPLEIEVVWIWIFGH